jgi:hypothetical protein
MSRMLRIAEICNQEIHVETRRGRSVTGAQFPNGRPRLLLVRVSLDIC